MQLAPLVVILDPVRVILQFLPVTPMVVSALDIFAVVLAQWMVD